MSLLPCPVAHDHTLLGPAGDVKPTHVPSDARVREIAMQGAAFGQIARASRRYLLERQLGPILNRIAGLDERSPTYRTVLRSIFLFAAASAIEPERGHANVTSRNQHFLFAYAQNELTHAINVLSEIERERLFAVGEMIGDPSRWVGRFNAAARTARLAHVLTQMGYEAYLPNIEEDYYGKIDLIVATPNVDGGLCVRVSPHVHQTNEIVELMWIPPTHRQSRRLWEGVERFNRSHVGRWIPARVFLDPSLFARPFSIDAPLRLRRELTAHLEYILENFDRLAEPL